MHISYNYYIKYEFLKCVTLHKPIDHITELPKDIL